MTNNEMLANIEYLREKANVSYEEAEQLLMQNDGNVMRVLVLLERQGNTYANDGNLAPATAQRHEHEPCGAAKNASSFFRRALATHLLIEKKMENGERKLVVNVPALYAASFLLLAPRVTLGIAIVAFATGHTMRIQKADPAKAQAV